jgi:porin
MGFAKHSILGVGISWGEPQGSDESQVATEVFCRWQMSQNLALTPSVQFLNDPVFNAVDSSVTVVSLRLRLTL